MADENNNQENQFYNPPQENSEQNNTEQYNASQQQYYAPPVQPQQGEYNQFNNMPPQQGYNQFNTMPPKEEKASVGLAILSYLIPLAGLIIFLTKKDKQPKTAKVSGICALVSVIINVILCIVMFAASGFIAKDIFEEGLDDPSIFEDYDYNFDDFISDDTNEPTSEKTPQVNNEAVKAMANTEWSDYTVCLNGKTITLPCEWETFKSETGFDFKDSENAAETLGSNYYTTSVAVINGDQTIYVRFINSSDAETTIDKCMVAGINADNFYDCDVVFAKGIRPNDTADKDSITALFGEPSDVYDSEDSDFHIYTYDDVNSAYNSFEITVSDGKISGIDLEHFEF